MAMVTSEEQVQCPICSQEVASKDINLHLDLTCPGNNPSSGPSRPPTLESSPAADMPASVLKNEKQLTLPTSSNGGPSSPGREVIDVSLDESPKPARTPSSTAARSGESKGLASIFQSGKSGVKRKAPSQGAEPPDTKPSISAEGRGSKRRSEVEQNGEEERKPKVNAMTAAKPLAERSRPATLSGYVGQSDLVGPGSLLRARIEAGEGVGSCILWGPPGCGKTTLARLIAKTANADFKELSATSSGTADVRQVFEQAKNGLKLTGRRTILMIDEIHRFNKAQQDLFLPYVENGWVQLIGATTENPSFKVNGALLSRCQVFTLQKHTPEDLLAILQNALAALPPPLPRLPEPLLPFLADVADGDARQALNGLELALKVCEIPRQTTLTASLDDAEELAQRDAELMDAVRKGLRKGYDRTGEERYDMISALHKSLRGSDGSAAMYWLARMITGGEDAVYIARRLVVVASEDVGMADPHALPLAMATYQACMVIGLPECRINLAHCVAYMAEAPKSTRAYNAYKRAEALCNEPPLPGVPMQIRNAPTALMKKLGYGKSYSYNPAFAHPVYNEYLPFTLREHSSLSDTPDEHILKTPEYEAKEKTWDEDALVEWESSVNGNAEWEGRKHRLKDGNGGARNAAMGGSDAEPVATNGIP